MRLWNTGSLNVDVYNLVVLKLALSPKGKTKDSDRLIAGLLILLQRHNRKGYITLMQCHPQLQRHALRTAHIFADKSFRISEILERPHERLLDIAIGVHCQESESHFKIPSSCTVYITVLQMYIEIL